MLFTKVKLWIEDLLGIQITGPPDFFFIDSIDGTLIARILEKYNVISDEDLQNIRESNDPEVAYENFTNYVRQWLTYIGVQLDERDILEITHRDATTGVTLFYEVYLALGDTDVQQIRVMAARRKTLNKMRTFQITKVGEDTVETLVDEVLMKRNPLCEPILNQWDIINWEKDHLTSLMQKYSKAREEYEEFCERRKSDLLEASSFQEMRFENTDITMNLGVVTPNSYEKLLEQQLKALNLQPVTVDPREARRILSKIKKKHKNDAQLNELKLRLQNQLLEQAHRDMKLQEEDEFDKTVAEMLLKKSNYEKEIAHKLFEIRQQKQIIAENRRKADEEARRKRDEEFVRKLLESELEERLKYHQEQQELISLHKDLYEQKLLRKQLKHEKICREIVEDITDLAIKTAEYKKMFGFDPPPSLLREWAVLFTQQQRILDPIPSEPDVKLTLSEELAKVEGEISVPDLIRNDVLDEEQFRDYVAFRNEWQVEGIAEPDFSPYLLLGMNVIGYIVHKALLKRFPIPLPDRPNFSPEIEISVCTVNVELDVRKLGYLQRLLDLKSVKVFTIEDAIKFCMDAYEIERKTEFDEPFPDENLKEIEPSKKGDKKGKKGKKGKKDKKSKSSKSKGSKGSKGSKKDKKGKKGKKGAGDAPPPAAPLTENKIAQTPRLFPWERVVLSNKARLGKIAKAETEAAADIDDKYLCEMFVELLLSFGDNIKGWVLLNYPNNYVQAAHLEQALTGKAVPRDYFDKVLNRESLESVNVEEELEQSLQERKEYEEMQRVQALEAAAEAETGGEEENLEGYSSNPSLDRLWKGDNPTENEAMNDQSEENLVDEMGNKKPKNVEFNEFQQEAQSRERVMKILPDLVSLVYSIDFRFKDEAEAHQDQPKQCVCECMQNAKSSLAEDDEEQAQKSQDISNATGLSYLLSSFEGSKESSTSIGKECKCYVSKNRTGSRNQDDAPERELNSEIYSENYYNNKDINEIGNYLEMPTLDLGMQTQNEMWGEDNLANINTGIVVIFSEQMPKERAVAEDNFELLRISKIVPNPRPFEKDQYRTILTGFIKLTEKEAVDEEDEKAYENPYLKEIEHIDGLQKFYCDQGCYYLLEYLELNSDTVKCLAKMIIGDYSLPLKSSIEIFGERYLEAKFEVGDNVITKKGKPGKKGKKQKGKKKEKSQASVGKKGKKGKKEKKSKSSKSKKSSKGSKKGSKKGKGKKGKGKKEPPPPPPTFEDKEVQYPGIEEEAEDIPDPKPGEPDYEFVDFTIPLEIYVNIADFWVNMERNYVSEFKDLLWNSRLLLYQLGPYLGRVKRRMDIFIAREDPKQEHLRQFQKTLNEIDLELRNDEATKQEIICDIRDLKDKLLAICDDKMQGSEMERVTYINENWIFNQLLEFVKTFSFAFQLEIDRFVDTMKFVNDYYTAMILKDIKEIVQIPKEMLDKLDNYEDFDVAKVNKFFIDFTEDFSETVFNAHIMELLSITMNFVDISKENIWKPYNQLKKIFEVKPAKKEKKHKKAAAKSKKNRKGEKSFEPEEDVKENSAKIFEEWEYAVEGEFARVTVSLNLIKDYIERKLVEIFKWIQSVFRAIFESISERYNTEMDCVKKAAELLQVSVEEEVIIHPELTFDGDKLAELKIQVFPQAFQSFDNFQDGSFNIDQLSFMTGIMMDLAPTGFIMEKTFLLLVQDMLFADSVPKLWRNLPTTALEKIFQDLFDANDYVHWKDFIVCNLSVPFPTSEELMRVRQQFRQLDPGITEIVSRSQFNRVQFWFEGEPSDHEILLKERSMEPVVEQEFIDFVMGEVPEELPPPKWEKLRNLLFSLYQTGPDECNYTALLLDFCRDPDPLVGFSKALELSLGRFICYRQDLGEQYVADVLNEREIYERKLEELQKDYEETVEEAKQVIDSMVDTMISTRESLVIEELPNSAENLQTPPNPPVSQELSPEENVSYHSGRFITEGKYSASEIFGEAREHTNLVHYLPLDLILVVLLNAIPWCLSCDEVPGEGEWGQQLEKSFQQKIEELYEQCRNEDFNYAVLAHEFLNNDNVRAVFMSTRKFSAKNPVKIVKNIVDTFICTVPDTDSLLESELEGEMGDSSFIRIT